MAAVTAAAGKTAKTSNVKLEGLLECHGCVVECGLGQRVTRGTLSITECKGRVDAKTHRSRLRITICCQCETCQGTEDVDPNMFEAHAGRGTYKNWAKTVWLLHSEAAEDRMTIHNFWASKGLLKPAVPRVRRNKDTSDEGAPSAPPLVGALHPDPPRSSGKAYRPPQRESLTQRGAGQALPQHPGRVTETDGSDDDDDDDDDDDSSDDEILGAAIMRSQKNTSKEPPAARVPSAQAPPAGGGGGAVLPRGQQTPQHGVQGSASAHDPRTAAAAGASRQCLPPPPAAAHPTTERGVKRQAGHKDGAVAPQGQAPGGNNMPGSGPAVLAGASTANKRQHVRPADPGAGGTPVKSAVMPGARAASSPTTPAADSQAPSRHHQPPAGLTAAGVLPSTPAPSKAKRPQVASVDRVGQRHAAPVGTAAHPTAATTPPPPLAPWSELTAQHLFCGSIFTAAAALAVFTRELLKAQRSAHVLALPAAKAAASGGAGSTDMAAQCIARARESQRQAGAYVLVMAAIERVEDAIAAVQGINSGAPGALVGDTRAGYNALLQAALDVKKLLESMADDHGLREATARRAVQKACHVASRCQQVVHSKLLEAATLEPLP